MLLLGINADQFDPEKHKIISMASCTTNALAPVVKILLENFGIEASFFSTVHSYTNTQSLTDQPMKDRRDSWAATENIIPSSSGAARALGFIWKGLKITGKAYRVPTRTGSIAELNLLTDRPATVEAVNDAFRNAAAVPPLKGVMAVLEDEWASSRIIGDPHSSIVDLPLTAAQGDLLSVAAWYDNEMGYATRLAETAAHLVAVAGERVGAIDDHPALILAIPAPASWARVSHACLTDASGEPSRPSRCWSGRRYVIRTTAK